MQNFYQEPLGKAAIKLPACSLVKKLRTKNWQFFAIITNQFNASFLINSLGFIKAGGICYIDNQTPANSIIYTSFSVLPKIQVAESSLIGNSSCNSTILTMEFTNHYQEGYYTINVSYKQKAKSIMVNAKVHVVGEPLTHTSYLCKNRPIYQHHASNYYADGIMTVNGVEIKLRQDNNVVTLDYTQGIYPISTRWKWITGGGFSNKHKISFNIAVINETVIVGGIWVDDKLSKISQIKLSQTKSELRLEGLMVGKIYNTFHVTSLKLVGYSYNSCIVSGKYEGVEFDNIPAIFEDFNSYW